MGALPVRARLAARLNLLNSTCCLCGEEDKTEIHLFQTCPVARMVWFGARWRLKWEDFRAESPVDFVSLLLDPPAKLLGNQLSKEELCGLKWFAKYQGDVEMR